MIPRTARLSKKAVQGVLRRGIVRKGDTLRVFVKKNDQNGLRYGCSIAKKYIASAVGRNTAKRRICAALENLAGQLAPGYDYFVLYQAKESPTEAAIRAELQTLLQPYMRL